MQITFYTFSKRSNSTKIPTDAGTLVEVKLKAGVSIETPVFIIQNYDISWNYIKWNSAYYFINDVIHINADMIEIHAVMDSLASNRTAIMATRCNILYASDSMKQNIVDKRIPLTTNVSISATSELINDITIPSLSSMGSIILGITGKGSFGTYMLRYSSDLPEILDGVDGFVEGWADVIDALKNLYYGGAAADNLKAAIAIPVIFNPTQISDFGLENLYLGNYACTNIGGGAIQGYRINKPVVATTTNIEIPWGYSDWRRNSPYSEVILYLPFVGIVPLSTDDIISESSIDVTYSFNVTSGDICVEYKAHDQNRIIGTASANIAMNTPFGNTGIDTTKLTQAAGVGLGTIGAGVIGAFNPAVSTATYALSLFGGMAAAASLGFSSLQGTGSGSGGLGGGASHGLDTAIRCYVLSRTLTDTQDSFAPIMGKPYFGADSISNHSGFVMTEGASVAGTMTESERQKVNSMLDNGVYIE